ncbi:DUF2254 domain-containing protein [Oceanicaulis alexandrii]|uniref:DUF2254 domain-containing protein n=1 Tax=Oceanicaulis alexandrii TaxID=153233 RepID=UPI0003B3D49F|nr:DUF2254 family protein [Oceanicaulis alexandrii]
MLSRAEFLVNRVLRSIWLRPAAYAAGAALVVLITPLIDPFLPFEWKELVSTETNEAVLTILASSLLAVAIFSLSTMVAALRSASSSATPRARALLVEDAAAQNAISTFIGAFLFSLLGVIGSLLGLYSGSGRVILFALTVLLVLIVVATLIRWLDRLSKLGDVTEAIRRVEAVAQTAFDHAPVARDVDEAPTFESGVDLHPKAPGFVQNVALENLRALCDRLDLQLVVKAPPGAFTDAGAPLARLSKPVEAADEDALCACFNLGSDRDFRSDPCFGLIVLSEIASKALSPGVNDPGTAIHTIRAIQRVLHKWSVTLAEKADEDTDPKDQTQRVFLPGISVRHALECGFDPISFDGANRPVITRTLLSALSGLKAQDEALFSAQADELAQAMLARARSAIPHDADKQALVAAAERLGFGPEDAGESL